MSKQLHSNTLENNNLCYTKCCINKHDNLSFFRNGKTREILIKKISFAMNRFASLHVFDKSLFLYLHPHSPCSPPMLPVTRIRPCLFLFMSGRKVCMVRSVPSRLTSRIPRIVSSEWASRGPIRPTPALQTNTKILGGNQWNHLSQSHLVKTWGLYM